MERNYQNIEDFLRDESFVKFVQGRGDEHNAHWESWIAKHPESREMVEDAKLIIQGIPFQKKEISSTEVENNLKRLKKDLNLLKPVPKKIPFYQKNSFKWVAVASIIFFIAGSFLLSQWGNKPHQITQSTGYGETKEISFEDGSMITLNANSRLSYPSNLQDLEKKELRFSGEAYFDIKKQTRGTFYYIFAEDLTAKVLGTSFNIHTRDSQTVLSLDEGKISLVHEEGSTQKMEAGNIAWYDKQKDAFVIKENRNKYWNSWMEELWIFDEQVTFERILKRIENNYGLTWKVENEMLLQRKLEGSVSIESLDVLLESLSYIYDIEIARDGNHGLIIK